MSRFGRKVRNESIAGVVDGRVADSQRAYAGLDDAEGEGVVRVAAWPARFSIVYGCGLAALFYVFRIVDAVRGREGPKGPVGIPQH